MVLVFLFLFVRLEFIYNYRLYFALEVYFIET
jgi:hypothetical protein